MLRGGARALAVCVRQSAWRHASGVTSQHAAVAPLAAPRWPSIHTSPVLRDAVSELERPSLATRPYKLLKDGQESLVARPKVLRLPSAYQAYKEALVTVDELSGEPYVHAPMVLRMILERTGKPMFVNEIWQVVENQIGKPQKIPELTAKHRMKHQLSILRAERYIRILRTDEKLKGNKWRYQYVLSEKGVRQRLVGMGSPEETAKEIDRLEQFQPFRPIKRRQGERAEKKQEFMKR